jgi:dTDP-D-glucose 4,6-dehydratase
VYVTDTRKLQQDTGWKPQYTVAQTLAEIHGWWKQNRQLFASPTEVSSHVSVPSLQEAPGTLA